MSDEDRRGGIKHLSRYKQLISYEGLKRRRNITPTDIDGFIDYNGVSFVYMDAKLENKTLDYGQKLAYQHVVDSHSTAGHESCAIIFRHNEPPENIIDAHSSIVSEIYYNSKWSDVSYTQKTVLQWVESWEQYCEKKGLKL